MDVAIDHQRLAKTVRHPWKLVRRRLTLDPVGRLQVEQLLSLDTPPPSVIFDHEFVRSDGRPASKLYLVVWTPPTASPHSKMFYTSQKAALNSTITGVRCACAFPSASTLVTPITAYGPHLSG